MYMSDKEKTVSLVRLRKGAERRVKAGHLWVYSNEIDVTTSVKGMDPGHGVIVEDYRGNGLGRAYVNPHSLITCRIISRDTEQVLDQSLITHRLKVALSLREKVYDQQCYRWVYGESDGLPGLVIDRFGGYVVIQITTAGMEMHRQAVIDAVVKVVEPTAVLLRNDSSSRKVEGLEEYVECVHGEWPEQLTLIENGVEFRVPGQTGQKTGWFYDHRENRQLLQRLAPGKRVLDVFSYVGGWGIQAAAAGAEYVLCVDSSEKALAYVGKNAALNGVSDKVDVMAGKAFEVLAELVRNKEKYDIVVLDPPSFIKRKKNYKSGLAAYRRINDLGLRLLKKDGVLVSASCSMHLPQDVLVDTVRAAARHCDRHVQLFAQGGQALDHPVHPSIPETRYLKALFTRVLPSL